MKYPRLTAERERNLSRDHERLHPNGRTPSGRVCDVCVLLDALEGLREKAHQVERVSRPRDFSYFGLGDGPT